MFCDCEYLQLPKVSDIALIYVDFIIFVYTASLDPKLSMTSWLSKLESSSWLDYVQSILSTACHVAKCLDKNGNSAFYSMIILQPRESILQCVVKSLWRGLQSCTSLGHKKKLMFDFLSSVSKWQKRKFSTTINRKKIFMLAPRVPMWEAIVIVSCINT